MPSARDILADDDWKPEAVPGVVPMPETAGAYMGASVDTRAPKPATVALNPLSLTSATIDLGAITYQTAKEDGASEEKALAAQDAVTRTGNVVGPGNADAAFATLQSHLGAPTIQKIVQRFAGQRAIPVPLESPAPGEADDTYKATVARDAADYPAAIRAAVAGHPDTIPVADAKQLDKPWLQTAKDVAADVAFLPGLLGNTAADYLGYGNPGLPSLKRADEIADDVSDIPAAVSGYAHDADVWTLTTGGPMEIPKALAGLGMATGVPRTIYGWAEKLGVTPGYVAMFIDDATGREKADAGLKEKYETGDRTSIDAVPYRELPARLKHGKIDVNRFVKEAEHNSALSSLQGSYSPDYLAAQVERLPASVIYSIQPELRPSDSDLIATHKARSSAQEITGSKEAKAALGVLGAGLVQKINDHGEMVFAPSRAAEIMRLAGAPEEAIQELDIPLLPGGAAISALLGLTDSGDPQGALAKFKAARVFTKAGISDMIQSGAYDDWLKAAGFADSEHFAAVRDPDSPWLARVLADIELPDNQGWKLGETYGRAGGDPTSNTARILGTADVAETFLVPYEEALAFLPMHGLAMTRRARAAGHEAREVGVSGREARKIALAAAAPALTSGTDGIETAAKAIGESLDEGLESGKINPHAIGTRTKEQLVDLARDAGIQAPEGEIERILGEVADRNARVLDATAEVQKTGGPETQKLRESREYRDKRQEIDALNMPPIEKDALMRVLEVVALRIHDEGKAASPEAAIAASTWEQGVDGETPHPDATFSREESPAFAAWFGGSKIADEAGKPIVVYHGTDAPEFGAFDYGAARDKGGFWFTSNPRIADTYQSATPERPGGLGRNPAPRVIPAFLSLKHPLVVDASTVPLPKGVSRGEPLFVDYVRSESIAKARAEGADGVVFRGFTDMRRFDSSMPVGDIYLAFDPEQIKSATGNRGTFDPNDPNILHSEDRGVVKGSIQEVNVTASNRPQADTRVLGIERLRWIMASDVQKDLLRESTETLGRYGAKVEQTIGVAGVYGAHEENSVLLVVSGDYDAAKRGAAEFLIAHDQNEVWLIREVDEKAANASMIRVDMGEVSDVDAAVLARDAGLSSATAGVFDGRTILVVVAKEGDGVTLRQVADFAKGRGVTPRHSSVFTDILNRESAEATIREHTHDDTEATRLIAEYAASGDAHAADYLRRTEAEFGDPTGVGLDPGAVAGDHHPADPEASAVKKLYSREGGVAAGSIERVDRPIAPVFYSALRRAVEALKGERFGVEQLRATLKNVPGVKAAEVDASLLDDFLWSQEKKGAVSKADVLSWLDEHAVVIEEKTLGSVGRMALPLHQVGAHTWEVRPETGRPVRIVRMEDGRFYVNETPFDTIEAAHASANRMAEMGAEHANPTQYENYALPGGTNYRELLFRLPAEAPPLTPTESARLYALEGLAEANRETPAEHRELADLQQRDSHARATPTYRDPHFGADGERLRAWERISDRVGPNGEKLLHGDEFQSGLHQRGREDGYANPARLAEVEARLTAIDDERSAWHRADAASNRRIEVAAREVGRTGGNPADLTVPRERWPPPMSPENAAAMEEYSAAVAENSALHARKPDPSEERDLALEAGRLRTAPPDAPFAKTWHEFLLKRLLRLAAEGDYDGITWTTGAQQAARYDLSKRVSSVKWGRTLEGKYWIQPIGLDGRVVAGAAAAGLDEKGVARVVGKEVAEQIAGDLAETGEIKGANLSAGGSGMRVFYDQIIPSFLNKYAKKWGASTGTTTIRVEGVATPLASSIDRAAATGDAISAEILDYVRDRAINEDPNPWATALEHYEAPQIAKAQGYVQGVGEETVHFLAITPAMRDAILHEGQPLFSKGDTIHGSIEPNGATPASTAAWLIKLYRTGDFRTALHEGTHLFDLLMGDDWHAGLSRYFESEIVNGKPRLTIKGREQLAEAGTRLLRGTLRPGSKIANALQDLKDTLADLWSRIRGLPGIVPPGFREHWDTIFRPSDFSRPAAVALVDERAGRSVNAAVHVSGDAGTEIAEMKLRNAGRMAEATRVDRNSAEIRHALGLVNGQASIDPIKFLSSALTYIAVERMRKKWGFGEVESLTSRVAVPKARAIRVRAETARHMASAMGGQPPKVVAGSFTFTPDQQAGLKRLIAEVHASPLGATMPEIDDLATLPAETWNTLVAHQLEIRAGAGAFKERRALAASTSGALRLIGAATESLERSDLAPKVEQLREAFVSSLLPTDYLGPTQKETIEGVLRALGNVGKDVRIDIFKVAGEMRKSGADPSAVEVLGQIATALPPEVVPVEELSVLAALDNLKTATDIADVAPHADDLHAFFVASPISGGDQGNAEIVAVNTLSAIHRRMKAGMDFPAALADFGVTPETAADAMAIVQEGLRRRSESVSSAASDIFLAFAGSNDAAALKGMDPVAKRTLLHKVYAAWYSGDWTTILTETGRVGNTTSGPKFDQGGAALTALLRLKARKVLGTLAERMAETGVISDAADLGKSGNAFSRPYILGSLPLGRESHIRDVKRYIESYTGWKATPTVTGEVTDANGFVTKEAEYIPAKGALTDDGRDNDIARADAMRILSQWGFKLGKGTEWEVLDLPGGGTALIPTILREPIERVINTASPSGNAWRLGGQRVGDVSAVPSADTVSGLPSAINTVTAAIKTTWNYTFGMMNTGMTTGFLIPNAPTYIGNALGGAFQLYQGVGATEALKIMARPLLPTEDGAVVRSVIARMWNDGRGAQAPATVRRLTGLDLTGPNVHTPATRGFFTSTGAYWSDQAVAEEATKAGLNSSLPKSLSTDAVLQDFEKTRPGWAKWFKAQLAAVPHHLLWQPILTEAYTAVDNYYRVATFVHELRSGKTSAEAAQIARDVAFDYNALTEFEKSKIRPVVMFYSYMRRNQDLLWHTLLTNPHRILGQLRLARGLQQQALGDDAELFFPEWADGRYILYFRKAIQNTHFANADRGAMLLSPRMPAADGIGVWLDIISALWGDKKESEKGARETLSHLNPWAQLAITAATGKDIYSGRDADAYNTVPNVIVELDQNLFGGALSEALDVRPVAWGDKLNEPYPDAPRYQAMNGKAWMVFRNLLQVPGAGRSMDVITQMSRTNFGGGKGIVQAVVDATRSPTSASTEPDTDTVRPWVTPAEEWGQLVGIKVQRVKSRDAVLSDLQLAKEAELHAATTRTRSTREHKYGN